MTTERSKRLRQRFERRRERIDDVEDRPSWACGIDSCGFSSETVEELITHQTRDHPPHTCKVCNQQFPDGFIAIYHAFHDHNRADYVKAYNASSDDVRQRERIIAEIERQIDVPAFINRLDEENQALNL